MLISFSKSFSIQLNQKYSIILGGGKKINTQNPSINYTNHRHPLASFEEHSKKAILLMILEVDLNLYLMFLRMTDRIYDGTARISTSQCLSLIFSLISMPPQSAYVLFQALDQSSGPFLLSESAPAS